MADGPSKQASPVDDELIGTFFSADLPDDDIDRLLDSLDCLQQRARLCRHGMVEQVLAGGQAYDCDISQRVRASLSRESLSCGKVTSIRRGRWLRRNKLFALPVAGVALAASVAAVSFMVLKPLAPVSTPSAQVAQQATAPVQNAVASASAGQDTNELVIAAPSGSAASVQASWSAAQPVGIDARRRSQLDAYLINHARQGGGYALTGPLGYARVTARSGVGPEDARR